MAKQLITSPIGLARYPSIHKADVYTDDDGRTSDPTFKVDLVTTPEEAEKLQNELQSMLDEAVERFESEDNEYAEIFVVDDEVPFYIEEEDNEAVFKFRLKENGENKKTKETWLNKPNVYDARGKKIEKCPKVGGGSKLRVSFEPYVWSMPNSKGKGKAKVKTLKVGISLRMKGVQIIKLEQYSGATADSMGFGAVEDGYAYDPNEFDDEEAGTTNPEAGAVTGDDDEDF